MRARMPALSQPSYLPSHDAEGRILQRKRRAEVRARTPPGTTGPRIRGPPTPGPRVPTAPEPKPARLPALRARTHHGSALAGPAEHMRGSSGRRRNDPNLAR
ncbi:MAG: hypothetical protein OHK0013_06820 [Sandaracinaceae bacterium]